MNIFSKDKYAVYYYDHWLILAAFALLAIGFLLLASASMGVSDKIYHNPFHFLSHQAVYLFLGMITVFFVKRIPLGFWEEISGYLLLEPDFGAIVVMILTMLGMMYLAGARLWQFIILLLLVGGVLAMLAVVSPYRLMRLTSFLNPWAKPFDSGYQLVQSLIAFGRGGVFGVGLGNSIQKLFYLPEAHTDFF